MIEKRELRDRLTPYATVVIGIVTLVTLGLTIFWHRQETEDRVFVRIGAVRTEYKDHSESPEGNLYAQVVNIGARPIYIRKVELLIGAERAPFFGEDDLAGAKAALKSLAPGQEADFKIRWDFSVYPVFSSRSSNFFHLANKEGKDVGSSVRVETTRASIVQPANIYEVTDLISNTMPPKPKLHPPSWRLQPPAIKSLTMH